MDYGNIPQDKSAQDRNRRQELYTRALQMYKEEVICGFSYQQIDICGLSDRQNWKLRSDEKLIVYNMSFKK